MPVAMQEQAIKALIAVFESQSQSELETLQKTLPVEIKKFIALMGLASFQEREMESKKESLKKQAVPVREDALKILQSLIAAHPETDDLALVERSIAMAQRLHEAF
jgi:hypothetical protein